MKRILLIGIVPVIILSTAHTCNKPGAAGARDYINWVENPDNGLLVTKKSGSLTYSLQFTPLEYRILKEHADDTLTESKLTAYTNEIKDMQYYTFRIEDEKGGDLLKADATSKEDFSSRLQYFSSDMQKDLFLIEGNDTLSCLLFHFERSYGIDPRSTFVLGFPLGKKDGPGGYPGVSDRTFFFDDHQLGTGPLFLVIHSPNLQQLPHLNLD